MNERETYGVLLVAGLRTHQEGYSRSFATDERCHLVAVTDEAGVPSHREEWNRQFAAEMNLPYIPDLDDALGRDDVDIASVCVEHERRGRVAVKCAQAGKHLYLDKPMAGSVVDADAMVEAVQKAGVSSQVFSFIHTTWAQAAKKAVEAGVLGELVAVHCDVMFAKGHAGTAELGTPRKEAPQPAGFTFVEAKRELWTCGVYAVGLVLWLTNKEVQTVFGATANYFFAEHVKNEVEDFGLLSLTLEDGITATIASGRIGWMSHPQGGPNCVHLIGTKGYLKIDAYQPRLEVYADEPPWTPPPINPADPMGFWSSTRKQAKEQPKRVWLPLRGSGESPGDASRFIDYIEAEQESEMSAKVGAAVVETLIAGYMSAASGEVISLPLPRENAEC